MSRRLCSLKQIEQALRKSAGIQARAADLLEEATGVKCSRKVINDAVIPHPELQQASLEAEEETVDLAESVVLKHLHDGDLNDALFLKTKRRNRGDTRNVTDAEFDRVLAEMEKFVIHLEVEPMGESPRAAWADDQED